MVAAVALVTLLHVVNLWSELKSFIVLLTPLGKQISQFGFFCRFLSVSLREGLKVHRWRVLVRDSNILEYYQRYQENRFFQ